MLKPRHIVITVIAAILLLLLAIGVWAMVSFKLSPSPDMSMPDGMEDAGEMILLYSVIASSAMVVAALMILGFGLTVGAGALTLSLVLLTMKPKPRVMHVISVVETALCGIMLAALLAATFLL